jgi:hypothetical protein
MRSSMSILGSRKEISFYEGMMMSDKCFLFVKGMRFPCLKDGLKQNLCFESAYENWRLLRLPDGDFRGFNEFETAYASVCKNESGKWEMVVNLDA